MINITDENLIRIITSPGRTFTGKILLGTNTYSSILNIKYKAPFSASGALSIGETPSAMIDVEMTDISPNLRGMELEAVISIEGQDFSQGLFTVDEPTEKEGVVKFAAYDRMNVANGETYVSELTYPTTVQAVFDEVCAQLGYTAEAVAEGDNIEVAADVLSGYDCRTALGYLAAYIGKNCVCGTDGVFRMKGFTVQNVTVDEDTVSEAEIGKQESAPRYLSCTVAQDTVYTSGEGMQGISFVCPLMTQERLDSIFSDLIGTEETPGILRSYYSADVTQLCGDPRLETGDIISLECYGNTYTVPIMNIEREFDGGLSCKFNSYEPVKEINLTLAQKVELLTQETKKQKSHFTEAQTTLTENMMNALGLFTTTEQMADGSVKYYFHNKTDIKESTYIVTINSNGFAYTKGSGCWNGGNPQWHYGIDSDGNAVLNTLALHGLVADWIKAGTLQSLNGSTSFNLDKNTIDSVQEEIAPYIFVYGLTEYREILLHLSASSAIYNGEVTQHIKFSFVKETTSDDENAVKYVTAGGTTKYYVANDTVDEYDIVTGAKGVKITSNDNYYTKTGTVYFKKDEKFAEWEKWKSEGTVYQKLVAGILIPIRLLTEYAMGEASSNGVNISSIAMNDDGTISGSMTTLGSNGIKVYEPSTGNVTVIDKEKIAFVTSDAEGNATEQEAGFMTFDRGDGTRFYGNISDVYAFRNGASARPVFYKSLGYVDIENEPSIDLREYLPVEQKSFCGKLTLCHTMGCSEYQIYFGEYSTDDWRVWIDTKYVTQTSSYAGGAYRGNVPIIKGLKTVGQHSCLTDYLLTISTVNDTSVVTRNGASYMYLEILG
ncbi:MAG: hypothetical protein E7558_00095 [Ruminococcaceae bacterium]|nr:hypothetical protein [Oscillospiraceae bacterium]